MKRKRNRTSTLPERRLVHMLASQEIWAEARRPAGPLRPRPRSKYMPHQGAAECARRAAKLET